MKHKAYTKAGLVRRGFVLWVQGEGYLTKRLNGKYIPLGSTDDREEFDLPDMLPCKVCDEAAIIDGHSAMRIGNNDK